MSSLPLASLLGALAALGSAAAWAVGSLLFRRIGDFAEPLGMNLGKGLLGLVLLGLALLVAGPVPVDGRSLAFLALSGLVGIAAGDTLFFMALVRLDPRLTLLLATVGQVFTVVLAVLVLGEWPAPLAWLGIALVLAGVTWVMFEQEQLDPERERLRLHGVGYGLAASLCMSVGVVLAKEGVGQVPALEATFLRLAAGVFGLLLLGLFRGSLGRWLAPFRSVQRLRQVLLAVIVIIFGGFYLSLLALKLTDASLAAVLGSTEPLFVLPLAAFFLHERVSPRAVLGAGVAVGGVAAILLSL